MNWLRLSDVRGRIARVTGLCTTDPRIAEYVNSAQERLMESGNWTGAVVRYKACVTNGCITLAREIEKIEAAAICKQPSRIYGLPYEFMEQGPGILGTTCDIGSTLIPRGYAPAFDDVTGTGKQLAIWAQRTEEAGAVVNLQYYDGNGQWVRTSASGEWIDGENIAIPARGTYAYSTRTVGPFGLVRVVKPRTNGLIRLYEYNPTDGTYKPLGYYAPDEEVPTYQRYFVAGLANWTGEDCQSVAVDMLVKLRYIPAHNDEDFLLIHSAEAIRLMVQAIRKEEQNLSQEANAYEANAIRLLNNQLANSRSSSEVQAVQTMGSDIAGPAVCNMI